jgi:hypothetical protein
MALLGGYNDNDRNGDDFAISERVVLTEIALIDCSISSLTTEQVQVRLPRQSP